MQTLEIAGCAGHPINSLDEWAKYALPRERMHKHWKQGRSAYELGRAWTDGNRPTVPDELCQLLDSHEATRGIVITKGWTERETPLPPPGSRGPRCHDFTLLAEQAGRRVTICIEAKAEEPFGGTVVEEFQQSKKRQGSQFPGRLDWLTRSLLGLTAFNDGDRKTVSEQVRDVPYQLLTAIAGTLLEAKNQRSDKAIFLVHEFRTALTTDEKMEHNARALDEFLRLLLTQNGASDDSFTLRHGQLVGPLPLTKRVVEGPSHMPYDIPLFVGRLRTNRKDQRSAHS